MRTRPDIQQQAVRARLSALRNHSIERVRAQQVQEQRAHNTVQYRQNLFVDQLMEAFDRWAKGFLGLWR